MSDPRDDDKFDDIEPKDSVEPPVSRGEGVGGDAPNGDEEEETWTNQPAGAGAAADEPLDEDLLDDEDEEQESQPVTRKVIQNGRDVLCEELPGRASRAKLRMKPHLTCSLVVELTSSGEKFLFDWKGEEPKVAPVTGPVLIASAEGGDPSAVDSLISLTEQNLMAVRSGDLNPQVAMLADKIKVKGKVGPAVYLFNLVAPRVRS